MARRQGLSAVSLFLISAITEGNELMEGSGRMNFFQNRVMDVVVFVLENEMIENITYLDFEKNIILCH